MKSPLTRSLIALTGAFSVSSLIASCSSVDASTEPSDIIHSVSTQFGAIDIPEIPGPLTEPARALLAAGVPELFPRNTVDIESI